MIDDRKIILDNIKRYNNNIVTILFGNNSINDENILSHKFAKDWNDVIKIISETAYFEVMPNEDIDIEKMLSLKYYPENNKQINKEDYMTFD
jgi:CRISPR/Cas system-associated protein Csx1